MNKLFEKFVEQAFINVGYRLGLDIHPQRREPLGTGEFVPIIQPDITVSGSGKIRAVVDAKYKRDAFGPQNSDCMKNLGKRPGDAFSAAYAINDLGQVVGTSLYRSGCGHAVLWSKGKGSMLDLGVLPGATCSIALGINNVGRVVGYSFNDTHAFVWSPSTGMLDLNHLIPANSGWLLQSANAINDQGQIVGAGVLNGQQEAFLLTPQ